MKRFLISLLIFTFCLSNAQLSDKILKITEPLENYTSFYALNEEPEKIKKNLEKFSSTEELFFLANKGKNQYVKSVAVDVLIKRKDNKIIEVFKNSINSDEEVTYRTECLSDAILLSSYIFDTAIRNPNLSEESKQKLAEDLSDIVLKSKPINIKLLEQIRYSIPKNSENYSLLRKQVIEKRSSELLISLAEYKNPNDIDLIKSFGENAFLAIEKFPDEKFLPFLNDNVEKSQAFPFMFALSKFCNEEAKKIVDKVIIFKKIENKKIDCGNNCLSILYQQIGMNNCSFFQASLENLWLTDKIISFDVFDNYEKKNTKEKTIEFIMKGFYLDGEPEIISSNMYDTNSLAENITNDLMYDDELRLVRLLEKIKSLSPDAYNEAIRNSLKFIDDLSTDRFILKLNDNSIIIRNKDVLLNKLKTNESAYGLISIMDGIKILNDRKLYDEGAKIVVQRKSEFLKSKIWEKSYKEFIRENNIKE